MRAALLVLLALLTASAASTTLAAPIAPPAPPDPDVPAATEPVAVVDVFVDERFAFTEGARTRTIVVPDVAWDRVVLEYSSWQDKDPWDRLFGVAIDDVEVLRGTTPRTAFTLHKDVTEQSELLPPGGSVPVSLYLSTWVGAIEASVRLSFYQDEPTAAAVAPPVDDVVGAFRWHHLWGAGRSASTTLAFPDAAPSEATLLLTTSGHYPEGEFWWLNGKPATFSVRVDGEEVAKVAAMPYVYALIGFSPSYASDNVLHPVMWWSAHRALDAAGIHTGNGEIPAYRLDLDADARALLTGERDVQLVQETGAGLWVTSLAFQLDA